MKEKGIVDAGHCKGEYLIEATVLLGAASKSFLGTGKIPTERFVSKHGGVIHTRQFKTEDEFKAYSLGLSDMCGYEDWTILPNTKNEQPDCGKK